MARPQIVTGSYLKMASQVPYDPSQPIIPAGGEREGLSLDIPLQPQPRAAPVYVEVRVFAARVTRGQSNSRMLAKVNRLIRVCCWIY